MRRGDRRHGSDPESPRPRRSGTTRRWASRLGAAVVALTIGSALLVANPGRLSSAPSAETQARIDAAATVTALRAGDLTDVGRRLKAHRSDRDFAFSFASFTTPSDLGDALPSLADAYADPGDYELALTDLAGVIALATHGSQERTLPTEWTDGLVTAMTTPDVRSDDAPQRQHQDLANKQNLLLLLSRGYWSTAFLKTATAAIWQLDHDQGRYAWLGSGFDDARYSPAPGGAYLTDGVLALTAALTANPEASNWAFTTFQPTSVTVSYDDGEHELGAFAHHLFLEHEFPGGSDEGSVGMTAGLTALSAAINETEQGPDDDPAEGSGPMADSLVLQAMAKSSQDSGCSINPLDYGHCAKVAVKALVGWTKKWGHQALGILSSTAYSPPPFNAIGVAASVTNATWYAIEGDYARAGLSLATAVPGLGFAKLADGTKARAAFKIGVKAGNKGVDAYEAYESYDGDVAEAAYEIRSAAARIIGTEPEN